MIESVDQEAKSEAGERRSGSISSVEQMVAARQALGLGVTDIAAKLGMATRQIEAIERGDWQALPGQAFVRGALRAYGKTIGADMEPMLATLGGQVRAPELRASASLEAPMPRGGSMGFDSGGSFSRMAWILVGVAAVIAMAFYFSRSLESRDPATTNAFSPLRGAERAGSQSGSQSGSDGLTGSGGTTPASRAGDRPDPGASSARLAPLTPLMPLTPAAGASSDAAGATRNDTGSGGPAGGAGAPSATPSGAAPSTVAPSAGVGAAPAADGSSPAPGQSARTSTAAVSSATAQPPGAASAASAPAAAPGVETLRLSFERESWVDIREAGGAVLLFGIQPAGSTRELSGRKPFTFTVGNAQYVTLERGGKPVDLGARSRQGVARFKLD